MTYAHLVRTLKAWGSSGTKRARPEQTFANTASAYQKQIRVFDDPYALTIVDDESDPSEQRFITLGVGALGRLLVVVYAWRGENIRIISVRLAEAHERAEYEAER